MKTKTRSIQQIIEEQMQRWEIMMISISPRFRL